MDGLRHRMKIIVGALRIFEIYHKISNFGVGGYQGQRVDPAVLQLLG